jgi:flavin-binding protein dodecin/molybdopterin-binding protein
MIRRTFVAMSVLVALVGLSSIAFGQEINATSNLSDNTSAIAAAQEIINEFVASNETLNLSENVSAITVASNETLNLSENVSAITVASNETLNLSENVSAITVASNETLNLSENVSAIAIIQEINATSNLSENVSAISPSASDEIIELKLFGTSKTSWEDAVETAINSAEISGFRYAEVEELGVRLEDGKITEYTATVKLSASKEPAEEQPA